MNPLARINLIEPSMSHKNGTVQQQQQQRQPTSDTPKLKTWRYHIRPSSSSNPFESNQKETQPIQSSRRGDEQKNKRVGYYSQ